ncbi:O-acetyltransferase OatA [compost metagenome]
MLANVARGYDNATVIDWHSASAGHDEYFAKDGVHLNIAGSKAYAKLVASHMQ